MSYSGYLLKTGNTEFPNSVITSYKASPNQRLDVDSYRDGNGLLHRDILEHKVSKIWVGTKPLHLEDIQLIQAFITNRDSLEISYWNTEESTYSEGTFYITDFEYEVYRVENNNLLYKPLTLTFVEY